MSAFWSRFLGCCNSPTTSGGPGELVSLEEKKRLAAMMKPIVLSNIKRPQEEIIKELSKTTEGLIIILELMKLELAPMCLKLYSHMVKARSKIRKQAEDGLVEQMLDISMDSV